jgi:hypothetical protein
MTQPGRASRFLHRLAEAPWLITDTHRVAYATAHELSVLEAGMTATVEAAMQAQFEALTLLTRAVNELNDRLDELAKKAEPSGP